MLSTRFLLPSVLGTAFGLTLAMSHTQESSASSSALHAPEVPFNHKGIFESFDTASIRRGLMVYQNVCAACHSLHYLHFRQLVGVTHTEEQAKALAAKAEIIDGPNEKGEMFTRPGRLTDPFPKPYPNEEAARYANNGGLPHDLTLMVKARHGGEDYLFALLTGYGPAPAGISVRRGLYYNPYFPGGLISMPPPLADGQVDYPDGTPNTQSQLAKDVITFLAWVAEPTQDERKLFGLKACFMTLLAMGLTGYYKRWRWNAVKTQKISWLN